MADEEVVILLTAKFNEYERRLELAERSSNVKFKQMADSAEHMATRMERAISASSGKAASTFRALAGSFATYFTGRELVGLVDGFTRVQNSLRVAGVEGENLRDVQGQLLDLSSRYGVSLEGLAKLYGNSSQAASDLGASQAQLVSLTEFTAQALKITGTSAVQAQGAILGLTQALASGVVRAEEFNQVNEGGLRPLLQVAANTERFGGSIAKLRMAVADGKVTSQEFFSALMRGADVLEGKAAKATLTLSGSFEALNSRLMVYFGEADKAAGASVAFAEAIGMVADNLDTVIPALAVIATSLGVGFVTNAGRAAIAARGVGAAITSAFGGGIGIAITAFTVGLGAIMAESAKAEVALSRVEDVVQDARNAFNEAKGRAESAASGVRGVGGEAATAEPKIRAFAGAVGMAAQKLYDLARARQVAAIAEFEEKRRDASVAYSALLQRSDKTIQKNLNTPGQGLGVFFSALGNRAGKLLGIGPDEEKVQKGLQDYKAAMDFYDDAIEYHSKNLLKFAEEIKGSGVGSAATSGGKPARKKGGGDAKKSGPSAAQIEAEYQLSLKQTAVEELQARADLSKAVEDRLAAELAGLALDQERYNLVAKFDEKLSDAQKQELIAANGKAVALKMQVLRAEAVAEMQQKSLDMQRENDQRSRDALEAQANLADTRRDHLAIERRILDAAEQSERAELEVAIAMGKVADAAKARADLATAQTARRERTERDHESPLQAYRREIDNQAHNVDDYLQDSAVDALKDLNDGLTDAIVNSKSLQDVFSSVAKSIIADLIRIAIQQTVVNTLMKAMSSVFGGGSVSMPSTVLPATNYGVLNAASGTDYAHGGVYRVGESGPETVILPQGAKVIPATRQAAIPAGQTPMQVVVKVDKSPYFDVTVDQRAATVAAPMAMAASLQSTQEAQSRVNRSRRNTIP